MQLIVTKFRNKKSKHNACSEYVLAFLLLDSKKYTRAFKRIKTRLYSISVTKIRTAFTVFSMNYYFQNMLSNTGFISENHSPVSRL